MVRGTGESGVREVKRSEHGQGRAGQVVRGRSQWAAGEQVGAGVQRSVGRWVRGEGPVERMKGGNRDGKERGLAWEESWAGHCCLPRTRPALSGCINGWWHAWRMDGWRLIGNGL